eukprot:scaffold4233_cov180-Ochromonas_danica.AAC.15
MFSYLFGGKLGDLLAPRPHNRKEIWTYLKVSHPCPHPLASQPAIRITMTALFVSPQAGLFDKALKALSKPNHGFDVNERDEETGMVPLHYASAAGKLVAS